MKCNNCSKEFDYSFFPLVSITSIRLGSSRYFKCPFCKKTQTFDLKDRIEERHPSEMLVNDRIPTFLFIFTLVALFAIIIALVLL
ncbi:MAG: hypothetical protein ABR981_00100 [Candidatus Micrarchaeaceae archaeon]